MSLYNLAIENPRRVLLVEDHNVDSLSLRERLRKERLDLRETDNGENALGIVFSDPPDVILLDLGLRDLHGFQLIQRLKDDPRSRSVPIVALSGGIIAVEDKVRALDLGVIDFITRPVDPVELKARLRAVLRTKFLSDLLETQAKLDPLTGLANRLALLDRLGVECDASSRQGLPLTLLVIDLDHFKQINDRYGHSAGDAVLKSTGRALREVVRRGDLVACYGGGEFVILASNCDLRGGLTLASRLRETVSSLDVTYGSLTLRATASIGIVTVNDAHSPLAEMDAGTGLLNKADRALREAKVAGRNAIRLWSDRHEAPLHLEALPLAV